MSSAGRLARMAVVGWCLFALASVVQAQRAIPDDNLAYSVLIQLPDGAASGFYLNTATSVYLVTAKHVLFDLPSGRLRSPQMNLLSYPRDPKETGRNMISVDLAVLSQAGEVKAHAREDVAVVRIANVAEGAPAESSPGRSVALLPGGVVREFVPFEEKWLNVPHGYSNRSLTNSGYAIATLMDFVLELVK